MEALQRCPCQGAASFPSICQSARDFSLKRPRTLQHLTALLQQATSRGLQSWRAAGEAAIAQMALESSELAGKGPASGANAVGVAEDRGSRESAVSRIAPVVQNVRKVGVIALAPYADRLGVTDLNTLIKELGKQGDWRRALDVFQWMLQDKFLQPDERTYTVMIDVLGRHGQVKLAEDLFSSLRDEGLGPNVHSVNAMLMGYARNVLAREAVGLLQRMRKEGIELNAVSYASAVIAADKAGQGVTRVLQLFQQMVVDGIKPNVVVFRTLVGALCKENRVDEAASVLRTMQASGVTPDQATWNALINAHAKAGQHTAVESAIQEMKAAGFSITSLTYNVLIDSYRRAGETEKAISAFSTLQEMGVPVDEVTYNIVMSVFSKARRPEEAEALLETMQKAGVPPSVITYNTLFTAWCQAGQPQRAQEVMVRMKAAGFELETRRLDELVQAFVKAEQPVEAQELLRELQRKGRVRLVTYNMVVSSLLKSKHTTKAVETVRGMLEAGLLPDKYTFRVLKRAQTEAAKDEAYSGLDCGSEEIRSMLKELSARVEEAAIVASKSTEGDGTSQETADHKSRSQSSRRED